MKTSFWIKPTAEGIQSIRETEINIFAKTRQGKIGVFGEE